jgi:signal transduction histidine kinase
MASTIRTTPTGALGTWDLGENDAMALPSGSRGSVVRVHRGTVLVTQQGDLEDHVLEPGDELPLRRRGRAVAWAFTAATISLRPADGRTSSPPLGAQDPGERMGPAVLHGVKNSLAAMKALVQLGLRNPAEGASHARLTTIEVAVARMQELLDGYLSSTQPFEAARLLRTELGQLVSETLQLLSAQASQAGVRLLTRGGAVVEADSRRLKEALVNLVSNAIQATPPGGEVVVEVRPSPGQAELVVRDTGRGMAPETLRRLGTPFFTTRRDGTGLGVVLARSVIAQHGGSMRYESQPGKGTTVRATLPSRARAA